MIFSIRDLPHIKRHLLILLSTLCIGGTSIVLSKNFAAHAQSEQQAAQRQLDSARAQLAAAEEDRKNMKEYTLEYGQLIERNIIGDGRRLEWIEGMDRIRQQHRVLDFNYTISPQHPYTFQSRTSYGNFELGISDMALQFDLLHEEQLLDFFDTLHSDTRGWFILSSCTLERTAEAETPPRLRAACTGGWLTLKIRSTA